MGDLLTAAAPVQDDLVELPDLLWVADGPGGGIRDDVVLVRTDALLQADSPRLAGINEDHVQAIADSEQGILPILVHRRTMRVIDGMHRLRAAALRGEEHIGVRFFEGSEEDAFILSVRSNNAHGLPLTRADRRAAAARLLATHPDWSDRAVARIVGMSPHTVAGVRRSSGQSARLDSRVGEDGRRRPVSTAEARRRAGELLAARPGASLRDIAREVGLSPTTVRDVKQRLQRGEEPARAAATESARNRTAQPRRLHRPVNRSKLLQQLMRDPSLRLTENGRSLLRLLSAHDAVSPEAADAVPLHCAHNVALLARQRATALHEFADRLQRRCQAG